MGASPAINFKTFSKGNTYAHRSRNSGRERKYICLEASERPTYTEAQQKHIESLIRSSMGRAAHGLREELAATRAEAAITGAELALYKSAANPELITAREQLAAEQIRAKTAESRELDARTNAALFEALEAEAVIAPSDSVKLLKESVTWKDGQIQGVDGRPLVDVIKDYAASRPHLVEVECSRGNWQ